MKNLWLANCFWAIFFLVALQGINAQQVNEAKPFLDDFRGTVSVTHNGISLIPSFSLGDPAALFDLKFTKGRFSFEPDMRFALEGKPWSFLFWFRYKAVQHEKFSLRLGVHPALNFRTITINRNGADEEILESRRFLASEIAPSYQIGKNVGVGLYYLYSYGLDNSAKNNHFIVASVSFSKINLTEQFHLSFSPQAYYLKQDDIDGFYAVAFFTLSKEGFPLSVSSILNKAIDTRIQPEKDFTWNVSLNYRIR
jgi:hypothetical protein